MAKVTIEVSEELAGAAIPDVFGTNDELVARRIGGGAERFAAVRFATRAGVGQLRPILRRRCLEAARQAILRAWPTLAMWLLACHSAWQPKTRISAYRRLWKSLESSGLVLPTGERVAERELESEDGVRFFGEVGVPMDEVDRAYQVLDAEPASLLVASTKARSVLIDDELVAAWRQVQDLDLASWLGVARRVCRDGHILFRPFGFFDDVEVGTDIILEAGSLETLLGKTKSIK